MSDSWTRWEGTFSRAGDGTLQQNSRYCRELLNPWVDLARRTQKLREDVQVGIQVCAFVDFHLQNGKLIYLFPFKRLAMHVRVNKKMQRFEEVGSLNTGFSVCLLG